MDREFLGRKRCHLDRNLDRGFERPAYVTCTNPTFTCTQGLFHMLTISLTEFVPCLLSLKLANITKLSGWCCSTDLSTCCIDGKIAALCLPHCGCYPHTPPPLVGKSTVESALFVVVHSRPALLLYLYHTLDRTERPPLSSKTPRHKRLQL